MFVLSLCHPDRGGRDYGFEPDQGATYQPGAIRPLLPLYNNDDVREGDWREVRYPVDLIDEELSPRVM